MQCIVKIEINFLLFTIHCIKKGRVICVADIPTAATYLDDKTIQDACAKIKEYAADYETMGNAIKNCSDYFTKDVLQVEGETLEEGIQASGEELKQIKTYIVEFADKISQASKSATSRIQTEINRQIAAASGGTGTGSNNGTN